MSELAPGIYVSDLVEAGKAFVLNLELLVPDGPRRGVAVNPDDWARLPAGFREQLLDDVTRGDAERGVRRVEGFLAASARHPRALTLYRCPSCGHEEWLDPCDWQEYLPACPVVAIDPVNEPSEDEDDLRALCPGTDMDPIHPTKE